MTVLGGTETIVNTKVAGPQTGSTLTTLEDGRWVVTWISGTSTAADRGVRSQIFNADGTKDGDEFSVWTTLKVVGFTSTTALADGGWLVTYEWDDQDLGVYTANFQAQQRFDSSSKAVGAADTISLLSAELGEAAVAMLSDGGWLVTWTDFPLGPYDVSLQRYDSTGAKVGEKVLVNTGDNYGWQTSSNVTVLDNGNWVVTWTSAPNSAVMSQLFSPNGTKIGGELEIDRDRIGRSSITTSEVTALDGGGFVVSWTKKVLGNLDVLYRQYDADGSAVGPTTQVHPIDYNNQRNARVTALDTGGFVITWEGANSTGMYDVYCQAFNADGSKNGEQVLVNTTTFGDQIETSVTALDGAGWVVSWTSVGARNEKDIMQRVFHLANEAPEGNDKTIDMYENGQHVFTVADFGFADVNNNKLAEITITEVPESGALTLNDVAVKDGDTLRAADIANLVWKPAKNASGDGLATLKFKVRDDGGKANGGVDEDQSANEIVFNVDNVSQAPSGTDTTITILEDNSHVFSAGDFGFADGAAEAVPDNFDRVIVTGVAATGTLTFDGMAVTLNQVIKVVDLGKLVYAPPADQSGTGGLILSFKVADDGGTANGGVDTDPTANTLTIDVTSVNDAPTGTDALLTIDVAGSYTFSSATFGFADARDSAANALSHLLVDQIIGKGKYMLGGTEVSAGTTIDVGDIASLTFTASAGEVGADYASLVFRLVDDGGTDNGGQNSQAVSSTITFDVVQINDAPVGADAHISIRQDTRFVFSADRFGFSDANDDPSNALSQVVVHAIGGRGTFMLGDKIVTVGQRIDAVDIGSLTFIGDSNASGKGYASLEFSLIDDGGTALGGTDSEAGTHTITFDIEANPPAPVNHAPVVVLGLADRVVSENVAVSFTLPAGSFADSDGDVLTYSATLSNGAALPAWLSFDAATRTFHTTPGAGTAGVVSVTVTASDGLASASDMFDILVTTGGNDAGMIELSSTSVAENVDAGTVVGTLTTTGESDPYTLALSGNTDNAFAIVDGKLVVATGADLDFETRDSYTVIVNASDNRGTTVQESFSIEIIDVAEVLMGTRRADTVAGNKGADIIKGMRGNDLLKGMAGDDQLIGGRGNDRLFGGGGADTFVFGKNYGRDVIIDFRPEEGDIIDLSRAAGIRDLADLLAHHVDDGGPHLRITAGDGSVLVVRNFDNAADLTDDMFVF